MDTGFILGLLVLAADIYAIVKIVQSSAEMPMKIVWILVILLLPILGLLLWFLFGPGGRSA